MKVNSPGNSGRAVLLIVLALGLSGCWNLKPAVDIRRHFVLTSLSSVSAASSSGPAVGVARIEIPDYLQPKGIAIRESNSEIRYSERLQWAERLDKGIQRVLGANLGSRLGSTNVALSTWRRSEIQVEVYVSVLQFESDAHGRVVLGARWRVTTPGAEKTLRGDTSRITRQGPRLNENPDGASAALSETLGELSREIATAISEMTPMYSR